MAWQTVQHFATGDTITEAKLDIVTGNLEHLGAAWTSYTPTWTGSSVNPAIGNGTLSGAYLQVGKTLLVRIYLKVGSTSTTGTGEWRFLLPNSLTSVARLQVGSAVGFDSSTLNNYVLASFVRASTTYASALVDGSSAAINPTSPITWATDDELWIQMNIEVA